MSEEEDLRMNQNADTVRTAAEMASGIARAHASFRNRGSEGPKLSDTITQSVVGALQEALLPALASYVERMETAAAKMESAAQRMENANNTKEVQ